MLTINKYNTNQTQPQNNRSVIIGVINVYSQSHSVHVVGDIGENILESLSLSDDHNQGSGFLISKRQSLDQIPMAEHTLREGLSLSVSSKHTGETERLRDWQECFHLC